MLDEWQAAVEALLLIVELNGPTMIALIDAEDRSCIYVPMMQNSKVIDSPSGGFMSWGEALLWGAVIVAVILGVLTAAYFLIQSFMLG